MNTLRDLNQAFIDIAKEATPTVVTVFTEQVTKVRTHPFLDDFFSQFFGQQGQPNQAPQEQEFRREGLGSGVIVSPDGYIITNNHVIAHADSIYVRLLDKRTVPAKVIGADPQTDIAVIKIDEKGLPAVKFGDSDKLQVGEWVLAVGSPLSPNLAHTVTAGIVSAKGRANVGLVEYEDFIQTDAAINPGNSGGALVNLDGDLVGINAAIATRSGGFQGIGFAVPSNMAHHIMESLIKTGKVTRGWLGVYIQDINQTMADAMKLPSAQGVLVADVSKDGPAAKAGLKPEDVILKMNGDKVQDSAHLRNNVATLSPGTKVDIQVLRDGKKKDFDVTLGDLSNATSVASAKAQNLLGFSVEPVTNDVMSHLGLKSDRGVVVNSVKRDGVAARAGLREGDVIVAMNRQRINGMDDFDKVARGVSHGDTVLLRVERQQRSFFIAFEV